MDLYGQFHFRYTNVQFEPGYLCSHSSFCYPTAQNKNSFVLNFKVVFSCVFDDEIMRNT